MVWASKEVTANGFRSFNRKNGNYYIILNLTDGNGKRKPKWIATGLPVKGNKKKAEVMLMEHRKAHSNEVIAADDSEILFADYIEKVWLPSKNKIEKSTYAGYMHEVGVIAKYFRERKITLGGMSIRHIEDFYSDLRKTLSECTVQKYHTKIHSALKLAAKNEIISANPAANVEKPKPKTFNASFYNTDEMDKTLAAAKGTFLELAVMLGFYGLRRSEVVGLRWDYGGMPWILSKTPSPSNSQLRSILKTGSGLSTQNRERKISRAGVPCR